MPGSLFDTSVWLAVVFTRHPFHESARKALQEATASHPAVFCRATQQSFLRLASTPTLFKAYGVDSMSNRDALVAMDALQSSPRVCVREEAPDVFSLWRTLATRDTASPKVWMDAYLAAFALAGGLRLATLDGDFKNFSAYGLDWVLVNA